MPKDSVAKRFAQTVISIKHLSEGYNIRPVSVMTEKAISPKREYTLFVIYSDGRGTLYEVASKKQAKLIAATLSLTYGANIKEL